MSRSPEEAAQWMFCHSSPEDIRSRICGCESLEDLKPWIAAYNNVHEQLPPAKQDIIDTIDRQVEQYKARDG